MRKAIIGPERGTAQGAGGEWLDLERQASVELSSEDPSHPIESAFRAGTAGWRAAEAGPQTIRLRFDAPQRLRKLRLVFEEHRNQRTQEFVLRWAAEDGGAFREIVRQQFTFSPPGTSREVEEYTVELDGVAALELAITPDLQGGESRASLREWAVA
jgi:hypothetical protein